ncbi:MAG: hypothetical protein ACQESR_00120 [Planctomycetota bacterium]
MDQVRILAEIRSLVRNRFDKAGAPMEATLEEAMLIRHGCFCGRRFHADGLQAIWFIEENQIKFYDREGSITEVLDLSPESLFLETNPPQAA